MKSRFRRLLSWLLFTVAALTTLVVLFYAEENWRGARAWAAAKRDLQARGESLDFQTLTPPLVPDDQNLAMAPLFTRLYQYEVDPRTHLLTFNRGSQWYQTDFYKLLDNMPYGREKPGTGRPAPSNWTSGHAVDLEATQRWYRRSAEFPHAAQPQAPADDVLLALTCYGPLLDELARATAERPQTRFPVNYTLRPTWSISMPHYNMLRLLTTTLRLRAVAELRVGQTPAARRDVEQAFRLRESLEHDPTLIAGLVDITSLGIIMQAIWEGLETRRWSADDLDAFRHHLHGIDLLGEFQQEMRAERVIIATRWPEDLQDITLAREIAKVLPRMNGEDWDAPASSLKRWLWPALPYWPRGWYEQSAAFSSRRIQEGWIDALEPASHRVLLAKSKAEDRIWKDIPLTPDTLLGKITLPAIATFTEKFAQAQTIVDQAIVACALEKYFLEHHAYPTALAALVPGYLDRVPDDVIDGAPLRYRLTADRRFQLYSIGWDGIDGGGTIAWPANRNWRRPGSGIPATPDPQVPSPDRDQGDWVWQYAPAEPPDPPANESRLESLASAAIIQG